MDTLMQDGGTPPEGDRPVPLARRLLRGLGEIVVLLLLGMVALVVVGRLRAPSLPDQAPDFVLRDLDGQQVRLSDLRGQTVVLNFWATWCGPCRLEIPAFSAYADAHPDVAVLGVAVDGTRAELKGAARKLDIRYPVLIADADTKAAYGVHTLPTTVVVDADGQVSSAHSGLMLGPQLSLSVWLAR